MTITNTARTRSAVVRLDDAEAGDVRLTGAKAANLARARRAGLPVLDGFVLTTRVWSEPGGLASDAVQHDLRQAWTELSDGGRRTLVVRSSSVIEDGSQTSMAGMFRSVLDVAGWPAFVAAVEAVMASGDAVTAGGSRTMAVLVQPHLAAEHGGVLFGADPLTGRADRMVIASVDGGPDRLVSGAVDGVHQVVTTTGRLVRHPGDNGHGPAPAGLPRRERRRLAELGRRTAGVFGGPQDVEWAVDGDGRLWLLQARPITAVGDAAEATGPVYGPGPVAETLPDALSPLEEDLWVAPLRTAVTEALTLAGTVTRRRLAAAPLVLTVDGRVAADLELLGGRRQRRSLLRRLDPRPSARKVRAAWRVGRLRAALPSLAATTVRQVDEQLLAVPPLDELSSDQLVGVLASARRALTALHGQEILTGMLEPAGGTPVTGASVALRVLADERAAGFDDAEIVHRHPVVLALVPPAVGPPVALPPVAGPLPATDNDDVDEVAVLREALRVRARWVQELSSRAAWELGRRLAAAGVLPDAGAVRLLTLDELDAAVRSATLPADFDTRTEVTATPPLPAAFRLGAGGRVVPVRDGASGRARGAGGGRGMGRAFSGPGLPVEGSVLVVRTLDPGLAPVLPRLAGLVAETGSVLSHIAILAREFGVPTVVGVQDAVDRFPPGAMLVVDGGAGEVSRIDADDRGAA